MLLLCIEPWFGHGTSNDPAIAHYDDGVAHAEVPTSWIRFCTRY
jgi:hypothetical protein